MYMCRITSSLTGPSNNAGQPANRVLHLLQKGPDARLVQLGAWAFRALQSTAEASQAGAWNFLTGHLLRLSGTGWTGCPWKDLDV